MSALPPKADILRGGLDVRFVPIADIRPGERRIGKWPLPVDQPMSA